jgi:hypothetical protein
MASSINASTASGGGVIVSSDATGNLDLQSGGVTVAAVSSTGVAVTGTLSATSNVTITGASALRGSYGTGGITSNFAAGDGALNANTTGSANTAVGLNAAYTASTVAEITAIGYRALFTTAVGYCTAVGSNALQANTTGTFNVALGREAGYSNNTGSNNTIIGYQALTNNTTGSYNVAVGHQSLNFNTTTSNNSAMGYQALYYNTASNNTAVGYQAMQGASGTSTGTNNAAFGYKAGFAITTSNSSTAIGVQALLALTTGTNNTAVGNNTGLLLTTGASNQVFGDNITLAAAASGRIGIGRDFTQGVNTSVIIGNSVNRISNSYTVNATWAFSSDERIKNVIGKDTLGLDFINDLEPVTFRWKPSNEVPKELTSRYAEENVQDTNIVMHGLIAQNVKAALDKAGVDTFTGWSEDEDGTQKLGLADLITPMINAIKELKAIVEIQAEQIKVLKGELS